MNALEIPRHRSTGIANRAGFHPPHEVRASSSDAVMYLWRMRSPIPPAEDAERDAESGQAAVGFSHPATD